MGYTLRERLDLHGTIVGVEAVYLSDPNEPIYMRLTYSDGRRIVIGPTGYESEGLDIDADAKWFDVRLKEDNPKRIA